MCKIDLKERVKGFKRARRYQEQERNKRQESIRDWGKIPLVRRRIFGFYVSNIVMLLKRVVCTRKFDL